MVTYLQLVTRGLGWSLFPLLCCKQQKTHKVHQQTDHFKAADMSRHSPLGGLRCYTWILGVYKLSSKIRRPDQVWQCWYQCGASHTHKVGLQGLETFPPYPTRYNSTCRWLRQPSPSRDHNGCRKTWDRASLRDEPRQSKIKLCPRYSIVSDRITPLPCGNINECSVNHTAGGKG